MSESEDGRRMGRADDDRETVQELTDDAKGCWRIITRNSEYHLDFDRHHAYRYRRENAQNLGRPMPHMFTELI